MILFLELPGNWLVRFDHGTVPDLFPGQADGHDFAGGQAAAEGMGRDQHLPPHHPVTRVHGDITHGPVLVVKIEILDLTDFAIRRAEFAAVELLDTL